MVNEVANAKLRNYFEEKIKEIEGEIKQNKKEITRLVTKQSILTKSKEKLESLINDLN